MADENEELTGIDAGTPVADVESAVDVEPVVDPPIGSEPAAEPAAVGFADRLRSSGLPIQGESDDEVLSNLAAYHRDLQSAAQFGYHARPQWNQFQQWQRQQQQQQPAAPVPQPVAAKREPRYGKLEYDPQWESVVTRDERGNLVPINQYADPSVPQKLAAYQQSVRDRLSALANDPEQFLTDTYGDVIEDRINRAIEQRMAQESSRQQDFQFAANAIAQQQQRLFITDQNGNPLVDPATGQRQLNAAGHIYASTVAEAARAGITSSAIQHYIALGKLKEMEGMTQAAPAAAQQPPSNRINQAVTRTPNRNGSVRQSDRTDFTQNPGKSLLQQMLQDAREAGIDLAESV